MSIDSAGSGKAPSGRRAAIVRDLRLNNQLYLIIIPIVFGFILFKFVPLFGLIIAFKDYSFAKGPIDSPWVGLDNFASLVNDPYFGRVVSNTLVLGALTLIVTFPLPIIFALALNEVRHTRFKSTIQSMSYLPFFVSTIVIVGIILDLFNTKGLVNNGLGMLGVGPIKFVGTEEWFRPLYLLSHTWASFGVASILYIAALTAIPTDQYEAAAIDGASRLQRIRYVTLPGILPVILILFVLAVGEIARVGFERVYFLQTPSTYAVSDVLETYVYRRGLKELDFGYAAAVGLFNSVMVLVLVFTANKIATRSPDRRGLW